MDNFLTNVPVNGKVKETKRKLKIVSIHADIVLIYGEHKSM